jgi:hypothetical protein
MVRDRVGAGKRETAIGLPVGALHSGQTLELRRSSQQTGATPGNPLDPAAASYRAALMVAMTSSREP